MRAMRASIPLSQSQDPLAATHLLEPTPLTVDEYRDLSEEYLENLQFTVEDMMEQGSDLDVEYSVSCHISVSITHEVNR